MVLYGLSSEPSPLSSSPRPVDTHTSTSGPPSDKIRSGAPSRPASRPASTTPPSDKLASSHTQPSLITLASPLSTPPTLATGSKRQDTRPSPNRSPIPTKRILRPAIVNIGQDHPVGVTRSIRHTMHRWTATFFIIECHDDDLGATDLSFGPRLGERERERETGQTSGHGRSPDAKWRRGAIHCALREREWSASWHQLA